MVQMLFNSGPLLTVILIDMAALLMYNFSGMCVTGECALLPQPGSPNPVGRAALSQPSYAHKCIAVRFGIAHCA